MLLTTSSTSASTIEIDAVLGTSTSAESAAIVTISAVEAATTSGRGSTGRIASGCGCGGVGSKVGLEMATEAIEAVVATGLWATLGGTLA